MTAQRTFGIVVLVASLAACGDDSKPRDARVDVRRDRGAPDSAGDAGTPDQQVVGDRGKGERPAAKEAGPDLPQLPGNSACLKPQPVTLTGGKAKVTGTTMGLVNELGGVKCGTDLITPLLGPQGYYSLTLTGGKIYRFSVTAAFTGGAFYLFSSAAGCKAAGIESDCQSGVTGTRLSPLTATAKDVYFTPKASGTFLFAVDGAGATAAGAFTVDIEELAAPPNGTCGKAQPIVLASGKAIIQGNTVGSTDEFAGALKCGGYTAFAGPQVYYSFQVPAGKSFKLKLTPTFEAYLYVFSDSAGCSPGPINLYCASAGATGDKMGAVPAGTTKSLVFSPYPPAGTYIIAIDSTDSFKSGAFTLEVEEFTPPGNGTCASAQPITMSGTKATVTGTTLGLKDEFSTVKCGGYSAFVGPQAYYSLAMTGGKAYKITITPAGFSAYFYIFSSKAACLAAGVETDCASKGVNGEKWGSFTSATTAYFTPGATDTYVLVVDSTSSSASGDFTLEVEEVAAPANGTCATATALTLSGGTVSVSGTTAATKDEFATLKCGGYNAFAGPQAYYKLGMTQGKIYKLTVTPTFSAYLYLFSSTAGCSFPSIETECASKGVNGEKWGSFSAKTTNFFLPTKTDTYTIGIDSTTSSAQGDFTLEIEELSPPANATCAAAQPITLVAGKATVNGITFGAKDEFSTLKCGGYSTLTGPQVYYKVDLLAGKAYKLTVVTSFTAYLYAFKAASCAVADIETDCASKGATGDKWGAIYSYSSATYTFTPGSPGAYYLAIDSTSSTTAGSFTLTVEE